MPHLIINVDPKPNCTLTVGKLHAAKRRSDGEVHFDATAACNILFDNHDVLGMDKAFLHKGLNKYFVQADPDDPATVTTRVSIEGCPPPTKSGPTDIIVP